MKKVVLTYGLITGVLFSVIMAFGWSQMSEHASYGWAEVLGFLKMFKDSSKLNSYSSFSLLVPPIPSISLALTFSAAAIADFCLKQALYCLL